jgi:hypothetical protein
LELFVFIYTKLESLRGTKQSPYNLNLANEIACNEIKIRLNQRLRESESVLSASKYHAALLELFPNPLRYQSQFLHELFRPF